MEKSDESQTPFIFLRRNENTVFIDAGEDQSGDHKFRMEIRNE